MYLRDHERKALEAMVPSDRRDKQKDQDSGFDHFNLSCDIVLMRTCRTIEGNEEGKHAEILEWLRKKNQFSTVFISFGSENYLSKDQMAEIAKGLVVEAGVGIEVERDENGGFGGTDVADAINKVVVEETGEVMRLKASELSEKMKNEEEDAVNDTADKLRRLCMEHKLQK
ncbi:UDP-glucosyltransferase 29 [Sesamum angolense]|uniref:UDP-glucosyltransferase 29 n=1 Tax=Sesamum angolense TaxID=2727404 RepID=A0AAE2C1T2_9LAMI|nr:UDP-glucosyltransferase 29 [Sesamum angolense]